MKKTVLSLIIAIFTILAFQAQSPQVLNYQGVLKNKDGSIRPNATAMLVIEFVQDGHVVYSETHNITTNPGGFFSLHPGAGEAIEGSFDRIDWSEGSISLRSILDGAMIAETKLTSVPYALYAQRVKGQEEMQYSIDSIGDAHYQTSLQVDSHVTEIAMLFNMTDTIYSELDSLQWAIGSLSDSTATMYEKAQWTIDSLSVTTTQLHQIADSIIDSLSVTTTRLLGNDTILSLRSDTLSHDLISLSQEVDSLFGVIPFFNATVYSPLSGGYHTEISARQAVPQRLRQAGLVVTFRSDTLNWRSVQYLHNDTALWDNNDNWCNYGYYGNITLPYAQNATATRLQVPKTSRRQGLIISYCHNNEIVNEQYILSKYDDNSWGNDNSWMQLLLTSKELDKMRNQIAIIDAKVNGIRNVAQEMSEFGTWFYIDNNQLFTQGRAIDYDGNLIPDMNLVHTHLIPLEKVWLVKAYGNKNYPAISFFSSNRPETRLKYEGDTISSDAWTLQTFDFALDRIPAGAQYFSVNMALEKMDSVVLKERVPVTHMIDASVKYNYRDVDNAFSYIGAYVNCNGGRVINADYRHSRFFSLDGCRYKVVSRGSYSSDKVVPVIVYYSDASFNKVVGHDIGQVQSDRFTMREAVVSRETAPEGANYFVVNWKPSQGESLIQEGYSVDQEVATTSNKVASLESNLSCFAGRKLVTLGDSFTANSGNKSKFWQQWLAEWLGLEWSDDETRKGKNGYPAMGVGGAWITPNDINSMSIRCHYAKRYSPHVVIVYGGQNDQIPADSLGSIDDKPFIPSQIVDLTGQSSVVSLGTALEYMGAKGIAITDNMVIYITANYVKRLYYLPNRTDWQSEEAWIVPRDSVSFYSAYKGIVETLCRQNPFATIYCMTLMQCDESRYDGSLGSWEELNALRLAKNEAIKEIAAYYNVQLIDLWNKSGVTPYNAASLYNDWLHPNHYGYRKLAECVYREMK